MYVMSGELNVCLCPHIIASAVLAACQPGGSSRMLHSPFASMGQVKAGQALNGCTELEDA